jgi:predicted nuclease with TOPRIM domain
MKLFLTQTQAKAEILERDVKIADLEDKIREQSEASSNESSALALQVEELQAEVSRLKQENKDLSEENEETKAELDANASLINDANEKLESFDAKVEAAAIAKFESLGGAPAPVAKAEGEDPDSIVRQFQSMPAGEERSKFFQENKEFLRVLS